MDPAHGVQRVRLSDDPRPYGGWESAGHVLRGEFVGHYLMAASTAAAATGDAELKARVEYVVGVLEQVQAADGCPTPTPTPLPLPLTRP